MNATTGEVPANLNPLRKFNKFVTIIFLSLLLGLAAGEPVLASSSDVGTIDFDSLGTNAMTITIYASQGGYYIGDDMHELKVPVYIRFTNGSDISPYSYSYLTGISRYNVGINIFGTDPSTPVNVNPAYFEGVITDNLHVLWNTANGLRIYYDNYRIDSGQSNYREIFIGYMVYQFDTPSSGFQYTLEFPSKTGVAPTNNNMRATAYEYGFVEAMVYSLDSCESLADIYSTLLMIAQDTDYLRAILEGLETLDSHVLYLLQTADEIRDLLDSYINPTENPAAEAASNAAHVAESAVGAEAAAVASLAALSPGNMQDLDDADPMGVLDDISTSTQFWGNLVLGFSEYSSALWGVFIFALLVGLIAFILRLR